MSVIEQTIRDSNVVNKIANTPACGDIAADLAASNARTAKHAGERIR